MKSKTARTGVVISPYTGKTVDAAIAHLELVLSFKGATTVLGRDYWRGRLTQIAVTQGLTPGQRVRMARLPALLESTDVASAIN